MRTYNFIYQNKKFNEQIDYTLFQNQQNILIQVFCGQDRNILEYIINHLLDNIPHAICIGSTTDGEIKDNKVSTLKTVISISIFDNTKIKASFKNSSDSYKNGFDIANEIITPNSKLIITFTDGTTTNGEEYLNGITSLNSNIMVCGGMAGDNGNFDQTYISIGRDILEYGSIAVSLNSDTLEVRNDHKYDWSPIGIEHTIDKVKGNRIYKISGMKAVDFYEKYLGNSHAHAEFPLIVKRNSTDIARAVLTKYSDGSLGCAGNLYEGDKVRLGFANAELIMRNPVDYLKNIHNYPAESFFIYSCMARRRYMQNLIKVEIEPFASIAPTSGFFTYGEFFHTGSGNELMNETITLVGLTENPDKKKEIPTKTPKVHPDESSYAKTIQALTSLIQQSAKDQNEQEKKLEEQIEYSNNLLKNQKLFLRHAVHETNTPLSVLMSNIDLHEMYYGRNKYLDNIEVAVKNLFSIYDDLSYLVKKDQVNDRVFNIDFVDLVRNRIEFFKSVALQVNSEFIFNVTSDQLIIQFNETKLLRLIDNTITNAIKYTNLGKPIRVDILKKGNGIKFSISSNSKVIQQPEKIFDEYYREERSKDGFGLGLNLVKRICDEENVEIDVISNDEITSFTYIFKGQI